LRGGVFFVSVISPLLCFPKQTHPQRDFPQKKKKVVWQKAGKKNVLPPPIVYFFFGSHACPGNKKNVFLCLTPLNSRRWRQKNQKQMKIFLIPRFGGLLPFLTPPPPPPDKNP